MKSFKEQTAVVKKPVFLESIRFEHYYSYHQAPAILSISNNLIPFNN